MILWFLKLHYHSVKLLNDLGRGKHQDNSNLRIEYETAIISVYKMVHEIIAWRRIPVLL